MQSLRMRIVQRPIAVNETETHLAGFVAYNLEEFASFTSMLMVQPDLLSRMRVAAREHGFDRERRPLQAPATCQPTAASAR